MSGETDLPVLLATMRPSRRAGEVVYVVAPAGVVPPGVDVLASVRESEGLALVVSRTDADRLALEYDVVLAWITLTVHSSLTAVGLTAAVSAALTAEGISCNVLAGLVHDHLLVPVGRADDALGVLGALAD